MVGREMGQRLNGKPAASRLERWVDSIGSATLPLLAGFSTTSVVVVSDDAGNFRWPGATILALAIASVVLIAAIQFAYHARIYLSEWSGQKDREPLPSPSQASGSDDAGKQNANSAQQKSDYELGLRWTKWTQRAYHIGIVTLVLGLALAVAPHGTTGAEGTLRWCAFGLAAVTCAVEAIYVVRQQFRSLHDGRVE